MKNNQSDFRAPIVAVLGHVDHGKTSLLDKIRQTNVAAKESGGITQHIGAYQTEFKGKKITFIDTPGHAAFAKMRSCGAQVADLAVLVVAADEGVQPQTLESLKYIQEAEINFLVALNKVDLPNANVELVKKQLGENGVYVEGYGGQVVTVPVSAKTGQGISELLEMILLLAEMQGLKNEPAGNLEAVIIESKLDSHRGPMATVIVRKGSLKIGDQITTGNVSGKVRAMNDELGKPLLLVLPGQPAEILGFKAVPEAGGKVTRFQGVLAKSDLVRTIKPSEENKYPIFLKADTAGTLEAIKSSLPANTQVIFAEAGEITEADILLAKDLKAGVVGFQVKVSSAAEKLAETENIEIRIYQIIYELLEKTEKAAEIFLNPSLGEKVLGKAIILKEFVIEGKRIAGCKVAEGEVKKGSDLHLVRSDSAISDCRLVSMKTGKANIEKAKVGEEFGAVLSPSLDFKISDVLVSFSKAELIQ